MFPKFKRFSRGLSSCWISRIPSISSSGFRENFSPNTIAKISTQIFILYKPKNLSKVKTKYSDSYILRVNKSLGFGTSKRVSGQYFQTFLWKNYPKFLDKLLSLDKRKLLLDRIFLNICKVKEAANGLNLTFYVTPELVQS